MILEHKILPGMKSGQIKHTNYKFLIGWSRWQDFKRMLLAERWFPGKMMHAFTSFCRASNDLSWHSTVMWEPRVLENCVYVFNLWKFYKKFQKLFFLKLRSCCGSVDKTTDSQSWGLRFEPAGSISRPLGKALYPHCLVHRKGFKAVGPLVTCLWAACFLSGQVK